MVRLLKGILDSERRPPAASRLTFTLTDDYPDKILESYGHVLVGRRGSGHVYSINALGAGKGWMDHAATVKLAVVEKMIGAGDRSDDARLAAARTAAGELVASGRPDRELISELVAHDVGGYGPFSILMGDGKNLEEIVVNSPRSNLAVYHSNYGYCTTNLRFLGEREFRYAINRLIAKENREMNSFTPIIDARIDNGARIHAQMPPCSVNSSSASIRLHGAWKVDLGRLVRSGSASPDVLAYLWMAVESKLNILIAGAPASGKTTMMLSLCAMVPRYERIITIEEDLSELELHPGFMNVVQLNGSPLLGKVSVKDQIINALHLRPDRIVVGELRGDEAREVFFGSNVGVPFMTTMHSSSDGNGVLARLRARPMGVEPATLAMLDLSVFMRQAPNGARAPGSITEYSWLSRAETDMGNKNLGELEMCTPVSDSVLDRAQLQKSKVMLSYARLRMTSPAGAVRELKRRSAFLGRLRLEENFKVDPLSYLESYGGDA